VSAEQDTARVHAGVQAGGGRAVALQRLAADASRRRVGIQSSMLCSWRRRQNGEVPRPQFVTAGTGSVVSLSAPASSPADQAAEIARLRRELERARLLPAAAQRAVLRSLLQRGLLKDDAGELRMTLAGLAAIGAPAPVKAPAVHTSLGNAAQAAVAAWEAGSGLEEALTALQAALGAPRGPRANTKRAQVLAMLRRSGGASGPQIAEVTGWHRTPFAASSLACSGRETNLQCWSECGRSDPAEPAPAAATPSIAWRRRPDAPPLPCPALHGRPLPRRPPSRARAAWVWRRSRPASGHLSPPRDGRWSPSIPTSPAARMTAGRASKPHSPAVGNSARCWWRLG